jgi:hypothetical protein
MSAMCAGMARSLRLRGDRRDGCEGPQLQGGRPRLQGRRDYTGEFRIRVQLESGQRYVITIKEE